MYNQGYDQGFVKNGKSQNGTYESNESYQKGFKFNQAFLHVFKSRRYI